MPKDLKKNKNAPTDFKRLTDEEFEALMSTLAALADKTRYLILEILAKKQRDEAQRYHSINYYAMTVAEIGDKLKKPIVDAGIRNHLNKLMDVGLVGRVCRGDNNAWAYYFNMFAIDSLLFENQLFLEENQSFMVLSDMIHEKKMEADCVICVFTGMDKGEILTLKKDETGYIGRNAAYPPERYGSNSLLLSSSYKTVTELHVPHLKVYYENEKWFMVDNSKNGTFVFNERIKKGKAVELPNNTFVRLSQGVTSAVIYVSYN